VNKILFFLLVYAFEAKSVTQNVSTETKTVEENQELSTFVERSLNSSKFKIPETVIPSKKRKKLNLSGMKPSTQKFYSQGSDEAELEEVMIEEAKQLYELLKQNESPDIILRLGTLYVEQSRIISYKLYSDYERKMEEFNQGLRKSKPFLNLKKAQNYNKKSLKLFESFRKNYPNHKRMDEVLFFLGFNFYQLKDKKKGIQYYLELERRFPRSFYLYESRFQLGEHYFQLKNWKESLRYYSLVSKNKAGKFYFYALYKMAWSLYKMSRPSEGLKLLVRLIQEGREFSSSRSGQNLNFLDEATYDTVLFYAYSKRKPNQARSFFVNIFGEAIAWPLLERLAYSYRDSGRTQSMIILFQNLIDYNPSGEKAFEYKYQIVEATYNAGKRTDIVTVVKEWVEEYGPGSLWFTANQGEKKLIQKSFELQELTIRNYALKNHQIYKEIRSKVVSQIALNLYKYYLSAFKNSQYSDQIYFWYAELLFDLKKYISAVKFYEEVISLFPESKYTEVAYQNQILALEKTFPTRKDIVKRVGKETRPVEIPSTIKSFIKVANRYITKFPRAENTPSILNRIASMYYEFNHFDKSIEYFKKISEQYPKNSVLSKNVNLKLLELYSKNKDYKSLETLAFKLSKDSNLDRELLKEAKSILEQISFKKAQDLSNEKKYKESAVLYEEFAKSNPSSKFVVSAFYNAGLNFEKAGDSLKAISMYSSLLTYKKKDRDLRKKAQQFLPVLYEKLGFYKKSAEAYVSFAKSYPQDSKSSDFWYNAGVIFDSLNDIPSAVYSYNRYYSLSKKRDRYDSLFLIAKLYERNKKWKQAIEYYDKFLKTPSSKALQVMKSAFSIASIYETNLKQANLAKTWHEKTLNLYRRLNTGVTYGARSHFYLVKVDFYAPFLKIKIPTNPREQERILAKKIKLLQDMEKALKPVIRYDEGESILSSLVLIGNVNKDIAQQIESAPLPKGLDKKGQIEYRKGIKGVIEPYVKKSIEHYRLAIKRSLEFKVYSEWIHQAYKGLREFKFLNKKLDQFLPESLIQETVFVPLKDDAGTIYSSFFNRFTQSFKYGVDRSDFKLLSQAIKSNREAQVLSVVSSILNKDSKNVIAINSLAFFYLKRNQLALAQLILNRLSSYSKTQNPFILNNLAFISLKNGKPRQALSLLKELINRNSKYSLAHLNVANIFITQKDYRNAYFYYEKAYDFMTENTFNEKNSQFLLDNYAVSLTGSQKWDKGNTLFQRLIQSSSPKFESLFNYSCFLAERSKRETVVVANKTLNQAKELVDELKFYKLNYRLRKKVNKLSRNISLQMKGLGK